MRNKLIFSLISLGILFSLSGPAFAHHGSAAYDMSKTVTVTGTVTDFQFVNPHVLISMDVKDPSGKMEKWEGELTSPNHLARAGWTKSTLKPGDRSHADRRTGEEWHADDVDPQNYERRPGSLARRRRR